MHSKLQQVTGPFDKVRRIFIIVNLYILLENLAYGFIQDTIQATKQKLNRAIKFDSRLIIHNTQNNHAPRSIRITVYTVFIINCLTVTYIITKQFNSFVLEQQYPQTIESMQQVSVELKESLDLSRSFKNHKTIQDKIQSLIKLRRYMQSILGDSQLQDELLQKYNLVKLVRSALHSKMNQQICLQIYRIIFFLSKLEKKTSFFKLFFDKHITLIQNIILQMLKASRKVVNKLSIEIIGNLVPCYNVALVQFIIKQKLIKQMYQIIIQKKIPAKEILCKIIEQILNELFQIQIPLNQHNIETIFDFLIAELPRYKRYTKVSIQHTYYTFAEYLLKGNNQSIQLDTEKIQKLLDIGKNNLDAFLIYFTWIIQKIGLTQIYITEAIQYLKIVAYNQKYTEQSWRVFEILAYLIQQKLTFKQNTLVKNIIDIVIKKGVKGKSTTSSYYQDSLISLLRSLVSGCHKNYSELIKKQHYYHIARWTIFMYENGVAQETAFSFINNQLIYAIQTLNVGAAKCKLPKLKLIVLKEKLMQRRIINKMPVNKENTLK